MPEPHRPYCTAPSRGDFKGEHDQVNRKGQIMTANERFSLTDDRYVIA
jgi:hypothetical protein